MVSRRRWQWARYMMMKVATRSSGTLGGRQRSRKLGNSGNLVATTIFLEAQAVGGIYSEDVVGTDTSDFLLERWRWTSMEQWRMLPVLDGLYADLPSWKNGIQIVLLGKCCWIFHFTFSSPIASISQLRLWLIANERIWSWSYYYRFITDDSWHKFRFNKKRIYSEGLPVEDVRWVEQDGCPHQGNGYINVRNSDATPPLSYLI